MALIALLVALVAQSAWPLPARSPVTAFYGRLCLSAAKRLNAGDRHSGVLAWFALVGLVLVPVALVSWLAAALHPVVLLALEALVAYGSIGFLRTASQVGAIEKALREGDVAGASRRLGEWQGESPGTLEPGALARLAAEQGLREAHHGSFGPLFWWLVLPGPLGLVLYPLAHRAARLWGHPADREDGEFGAFARRAFELVDWLPQRVTAFVFAIVGDFEDAMLCWREQAARWLRPEEGIVLASGAGALGVRLGDALERDGGPVERPVLGTGEPAGEDALASLEGLLGRALVLWLVACLLAAAAATF